MHGEYPLAGDVRNRLACHVECFRRDMKAAYDRYDADMKGIERYKGSTGYSEEKAKLDAKLKEKTDAIKTEYDRCFQSVLCDLKNKIDHVGLAAPTNDQLNLLTLMKLQPTISKSSLTLAIRTLANSPLALDALNNIAKEKGQRFWPLEGNMRYCSLDAANEIYNTLRTRLTDLVRYMERPGDFKRYVGDRMVPTSLISYDKDFDTVKECFMAFAAIDSDQFNAFFDFISGEDMTKYVISASERALAVDAAENQDNAEESKNASEVQSAEVDDTYVPVSGPIADAFARYKAELAASGNADPNDMTYAGFERYLQSQGKLEEKEDAHFAPGTFAAAYDTGMQIREPALDYSPTAYNRKMVP